MLDQRGRRCTNGIQIVVFAGLTKYDKEVYLVFYNLDAK